MIIIKNCSLDKGDHGSKLSEYDPLELIHLIILQTSIDNNHFKAKATSNIATKMRQTLSS